MPYVYRYIDTADNAIKYVGIVYSRTNTLETRILQHSNEAKFQGYNWKIEYVYYEKMSRTDLEMIESHLITLYETYNQLNVAKPNFGTSIFINGDLTGWKEYKGRCFYNRKVQSAKKEDKKITQYTVYDITIVDGKESIEYDLFSPDRFSHRIVSETGLEYIKQEYRHIRTFLATDSIYQRRTMELYRHVSQDDMYPKNMELLWMQNPNGDKLFMFYYLTADSKIREGIAFIAESQMGANWFDVCIEPVVYEGCNEIQLNWEDVVGVWLNSEPHVSECGTLIPEYEILRYITLDSPETYKVSLAGHAITVEHPSFCFMKEIDYSVKLLKPAKTS